MIRYLLLLLVPLFFFLTLSSCANMNARTTKRVVCNKLKSDLVFNGATSDTRQAEIENADLPLVQRTYDRDDCDQQ